MLIDYRFAPANPDQAQQFAKELVALRPEVLVGNSTQGSVAALAEVYLKSISGNRTVREVERRLRKDVLPVIGHIPLSRSVTFTGVMLLG